MKRPHEETVAAGERYMARGVSAAKEDVHAAIANAVHRHAAELDAIYSDIDEMTAAVKEVEDHESARAHYIHQQMSHVHAQMQAFASHMMQASHVMPLAPAGAEDGTHAEE